MNSNKIVNVTTPTANLDAANKSYVDSALTSGSIVNNPTVADAANGNANYRVLFTTATSGRATLHQDAGLTYNAALDTLYASIFGGTAHSAYNLYAPAGHSATISTDNGTRLSVTTAGFVGIGTTVPDAPLHVFGSNTITFSPFSGSSYIDPGGNYGGPWRDTPAYISFITENAIWNKGSRIWLTSDQRIKKNIVNLSADKTMNIFRTLRPISFDFIDPMKNNNKKHFGFIAQEVNEVLPEGISINTDVIPNNMMKGGITKPSETDEKPSFTLKPTDTDISLNYLLVTTDKPIIFDISNSYSSKDIYKFKVYCGKEWSKEHDIYIRSDYNVIYDKYTYVIGMKKEAYDVVLMEPTLFVYVQYIYDLHILDHDMIYTVATTALQEVDRLQHADKARITELEVTVAGQQSLINDILERLKTLEKA